jgi:hypothetical protein
MGLQAMVAILKDTPLQNVDETSRSGHTALLYAAQYGQYYTAQWLLDLGASISAATSAGNTVLHLLSDGGVSGKETWTSSGEAVDDVVIARMLISRGAPLDARNSPYDFTALDAVRYAERTALADELAGAGVPAKWPLASES